MELITYMKLMILVFVTDFWICTANPNQSKNLQDGQAKCQKEYGISNETYAAMQEREMILEDESDDSQKCFIECMLVTFGVLKDGQLDIPTVISLMKEVLDTAKEKGREVNEEGVKSDLKNCTVSSPEGKCTGSYELWKCLQGIISSIMHQVPQAK